MCPVLRGSRTDAATLPHDGQMGHTDPTVTLGLYAKVMQVSDQDRERLRQLVDGAELPELAAEHATT